MNNISSLFHDNILSFGKQKRESVLGVCSKTVTVYSNSAIFKETSVRGIRRNVIKIKSRLSRCFANTFFLNILPSLVDKTKARAVVVRL